MRDKRKKQHYVAQSILDRFSDNAGVLLVFDKVTDRLFPGNKRDIAQENYFYDLPEDLITQELTDRGHGAQIVEHALAEIDGSFNTAIQELIDLPRQRLLPDDLRERLAVGLTFQIFRTREYRNLIIEAHTKARQAVSDKLIKDTFPTLDEESYPKITLQEGHESLLHSQFMFDTALNTNFGECLLDNSWIIGVNQTAQLLYTSDNPVVKHHHIDHPRLTGWFALGVEIAFPLTPRLILIICDKNHFKNYRQHDGKRRAIYFDNVTYYNSLQVRQSRRQVYSQDGKFELAQRLCTKYPQLRSPDGSRTGITVDDELIGIHLLKK